MKAPMIPGINDVIQGASSKSSEFVKMVIKRQRKLISNYAKQVNVCVTDQEFFGSSKCMGSITKAHSIHAKKMILSTAVMCCLAFGSEAFSLIQGILLSRNRPAKALKCDVFGKHSDRVHLCGTNRIIGKFTSIISSFLLLSGPIPHLL